MKRTSLLVLLFVIFAVGFAMQPPTANAVTTATQAILAPAMTSPATVVQIATAPAKVVFTTKMASAVLVDGVALKYALKQNFPNPFNRTAPETVLVLVRWLTTASAKMNANLTTATIDTTTATAEATATLRWRTADIRLDLAAGRYGANATPADITVANAVQAIPAPSNLNVMWKMA